jgi:predicted Zn finger-like uncharacterized protein
MRIACPACPASYEVPDSLIRPGRAVRCARCGGDWVPVAALPPVEPIEPAAPDMSPPPAWPRHGPHSVPAEADGAAASLEPPARLSAMDRLAAHPAWPQSRLRLRVAWAASIVLLALGAWGAFGWRGQIIDAWPPSARMYALFGVAPGAGSPR